MQDQILSNYLTPDLDSNDLSTDGSVTQIQKRPHVDFERSREEESLRSMIKEELLSDTEQTPQMPPGSTTAVSDTDDKNWIF